MGFYANDLGVGLDGANRRGNAANETTAADAHINAACPGQIFENLQANRALASRDLRIVKGMDQGKALLLQSAGLGKRGFDVLTQDNFGAVAAGGVEIVSRS